MGFIIYCSGVNKVVKQCNVKYIFTPIWGWSYFDSYYSTRLVQPPPDVMFLGHILTWTFQVADGSRNHHKMFLTKWDTRPPCSEIDTHCGWFRNPQQPPFGCIRPCKKIGINYQPQLKILHQPNIVNIPLFTRFHTCQLVGRISYVFFSCTNPTTPAPLTPQGPLVATSPGSRKSWSWLLQLKNWNVHHHDRWGKVQKKTRRTSRDTAGSGG